MKAERNNTAKGAQRDEAAANAELWELLGRGKQVYAPDDFINQVLARKGEARKPSVWETLGEFWARPGTRLIGALAAVTLLCGVAVWTQDGGPTPSGTGPQVAQVDPATETSAEPEVDSYYVVTDGTEVRSADPAALQDAEAQTILQLDDYLAYEDDSAMWIDPTMAAFLP